MILLSNKQTVVIRLVYLTVTRFLADSAEIVTEVLMLKDRNTNVNFMMSPKEKGCLDRNLHYAHRVIEYNPAEIRLCLINTSPPNVQHT